MYCMCGLKILIQTCIFITSSEFGLSIQVRKLGQPSFEWLMSKLYVCRRPWKLGLEVKENFCLNFDFFCHHESLWSMKAVLRLRYIPPLLWGKSGHLQTALYGKMGRVNTPTPCGVRKFIPMPDGATATFDLFEPGKSHSTEGQRLR